MVKILKLSNVPHSISDGSME